MASQLNAHPGVTAHSGTPTDEQNGNAQHVAAIHSSGLRVKDAYHPADENGYDLHLSPG